MAAKYPFRNLVFKGGGVKAFAYHGVIEVLEEITHKKFNIRRQPINIIEAQRIPLPFPLEEHLVYSGSLLQETLNYQYMSFIEGMTRTYNWFFKVDMR